MKVTSGQRDVEGFQIFLKHKENSAVDYMENTRIKEDLRVNIDFQLPGQNNLIIYSLGAYKVHFC